MLLIAKRHLPAPLTLRYSLQPWSKVIETYGHRLSSRRFEMSHFYAVRVTKNQKNPTIKGINTIIKHNN